MDPLHLVNANMPTTIEGKVRYVCDHAANAREAGAFAAMAGYVSRNGVVVPSIVNRELWEAIGLKSDEKIPSPKLLRSILKGQDHAGKALVQNHGVGGKALHEVLITIPCELSHLAASMDPRFGWPVEIGSDLVQIHRTDCLNQMVSTHTWAL